MLEDPPVTFIPNVPRKIHGLLGILLGARAVMSPPILSSEEMHVVEACSSILTGLQGAVQLETDFRSEGTVAKQMSRICSLITERAYVIDVTSSGSQPIDSGKPVLRQQPGEEFHFSFRLDMPYVQGRTVDGAQELKVVCRGCRVKI